MSGKYYQASPGTVKMTYYTFPDIFNVFNQASVAGPATAQATPVPSKLIRENHGVTKIS
jgi:hypothetical protein